MTEFSEKIKQWVTIDSQLKLIHERTKEIRNKKSLLLEEISQYVLQNNIKNYSFPNILSNCLIIFFLMTI